MQMGCGTAPGKSAEEVVVQAANALAQEGDWELVSVCLNPDRPAATQKPLIAFFKRIKKQRKGMNEAQEFILPKG